jgi:transposase-like protein
MRLGSLKRRIPKLRQGSCFPGFLEPRRMVEKGLVSVIQEACITEPPGRASRHTLKRNRSTSPSWTT